MRKMIQVSKELPLDPCPRKRPAASTESEAKQKKQEPQFGADYYSQSLIGLDMQFAIRVKLLMAPKERAA